MKPELTLSFTCGNNHFTNSPGSNLGGCIPDSRQMTQVFESLGCKSTMINDAADYTILSQLQTFYKQIFKRQVLLSRHMA